MALWLGFFIISILSINSSSFGAWYDTNWKYRSIINLQENSGVLLTNFQVRVTIPYHSTRMKNDFSDLRFTSSDETTLIPYWIQTYVASTTATVWVKVPSIPASGTTRIYMYYGNPGAAAGTDYDNTMQKLQPVAGSVLIWHFDEFGGITTADSSGSGNNGTLKAFDWWNSNWQYKKPIVINNLGNPSNLTNYQVRVPITVAQADFWGHVKADGSDVRFSDTDNTTTLTYWIESWAPPNAVIWVKVPSIPASSNKTIYIYYGNAAAATASDYDNTMQKIIPDANNVGLWHFDEGGGVTANDSSGFSNHGSLSGNWSYATCN